MPDRPNDVLRAALVRALDAADAAGVRLSAAFGTRYSPPLADTASVHLQGRTEDGGPMLPGDARRILAALGVDDPEVDRAYRNTAGEWVSRFSEPGAGVGSGVRIVAAVPPAHVEDVVVEAVLAS